MTPWTFWIVLAAIMAGAEMMTGTFYILVLAVGALAAGAAAWLGAGTAVQIFTAALVSIVGFVILHKYRPAHTRRDAASNPDVNLDIDAIVRIERIADDSNPRVHYRGTEWSARVENAPAEIGKNYRVIRIEGSTLILAPVH